ncbi:hypothetical protein ACEZCY_04255 [Streptacidiphilus sp. N1-12]|uniref:Uncharacterized protein n=2 Tax=Streptacidiphilus alkalitolerans TaxID=3342712 RepID=A0ABV6W8R6_9ACTN
MNDANLDGLSRPGQRPTSDRTHSISHHTPQALPALSPISPRKTTLSGKVPVPASAFVAGSPVSR